MFQDSMVKLRPHHMLCMLTYRGKGYSQAFVAGFNLVVSRVMGGARCCLSLGPDDICSALLREDAHAHCLHSRILRRDSVALRELRLFTDRPVYLGVPFVWRSVVGRTVYQAFKQGKVRTGCRGCEWYDLCSGIALEF